MSAAVRTAPSPGRSASAETRIHIGQGEHRVDARPDIVLTTILGSCVAACMRDPIAGIGGMNHFLLPQGEGTGGCDPLHVGVHAMELLVNGLLRGGARRERLEAKLFGGARMTAGLTDIGRLNAEFAKAFLAREGIAFADGCLCGTHARRIQFWPVSGRARQHVVDRTDRTVFEAERGFPLRAPEPCGSLELF